jgi:hypothetical protein
MAFGKYHLSDKTERLDFVAIVNHGYPSSSLSV